MTMRIASKGDGMWCKHCIAVVDAYQEHDGTWRCDNCARPVEELPARMVSDQTGEAIEHRVCFVGLLEDDGTAFDVSSRFECFKVHGSWSIGPASELCDLGEWMGWNEEHGEAQAFEMAYDMVLTYLTAGAVGDRVLYDSTGGGNEVVVWCMDEPEHARYCPPVEPDFCARCGQPDGACGCYAPEDTGPTFLEILDRWRSSVADDYDDEDGDDNGTEVAE